MKLKVFIATFVVLIMAVGVRIILGQHRNNHPIDESSIKKNSSIAGIDDLPSWVSGSFKTDFTKKSVGFHELLDGGPGKNGIPALENPKFEPIAESNINQETLGLYLEIGGEEKFYPYNILVWHEIVNDIVGDSKVAVTFCPLCGSAVVYSREVGNETLTFRVSGLLRESNMVMYDTKTESFWNQSVGEAIVGSYTGAVLERLPFQLLSLSEVRDKFPSAQIMSTDTGYSRNYDSNPYSGYSDNDSTYFPVKVQDKRFPAKEVFYIVTNDDTSIAIRISTLDDSSKFSSDKYNLTLLKDGGEITVEKNGQPLPGYYEMWFSWAAQHDDNGDIWEPK